MALYVWLVFSISIKELESGPKRTTPLHFYRVMWEDALVFPWSRSFDILDTGMLSLGCLFRDRGTFLQ